MLELKTGVKIPETLLVLKVGRQAVVQNHEFQNFVLWMDVEEKIKKKKKQLKSFVLNKLVESDVCQGSSGAVRTCSKSREAFLARLRETLYQMGCIHKTAPEPLAPNPVSSSTCPLPVLTFSLAPCSLVLY